MKAFSKQNGVGFMKSSCTEESKTHVAKIEIVLENLPIDYMGLMDILVSLLANTKEQWIEHLQDSDH